MSAIFLKHLAGGLLAFSISGIAKATTYNAFNDISSTNPSGAWSYGEGVTGSNFTPLTLFNDCGIDNAGVKCWSRNGAIPIVVEPGTSNNWPTIPTGYLSVHPGGGYDHSDIIIQFTTPVTGYYDISWEFVRPDTYNNRYLFTQGVNALVLDGLTQLYSKNLQAGDTVFDSKTLLLTAGDKIYFGVNDAGWGNGAETGFNAVISTASVPEPTTYILLVTALGMLGVRRKGKWVPKCE
jgi:hypothetical protein